MSPVDQRRSVSSGNASLAPSRRLSRPTLCATSKKSTGGGSVEPPPAEKRLSAGLLQVREGQVGRELGHEPGAAPVGRCTEAVDGGRSQATGGVIAGEGIA